MANWFGASWPEIFRVVTSTLAIYVTVVVALRVAGRRTISQMSAFDFVVTIAIGSLVASTALNPDPTYGIGLAGLATLLSAQQSVALVRKRFPAIRRLLDFSPQRIYSDGRVDLRNSPLTAQLTEEELHSKLRNAGVTSLEEVNIVILEPDGRVSVLRTSESTGLWRDLAD